MSRIDILSLKAELVRRNLTLAKLSKKLDTPVSTLSSWLHEVHAPPHDLAARVEQALKLPRGSLRSPE